MDRPMAPARSLADLRPGDLAFGPIRGGAGLLVSAGQLMLGEGFRIGRLDVRHVFVVIEPSADIGTFKPGPRCVEAMPSGAREATIRDRWTGDYAYVRLPEDYPGQGEDAAAIAKAMIGTPYSFASYAALALWRLEALIMRRYAGSTTWRGKDKPGMGSRLEAWIDRRKDSWVPWPNEGHGAGLRVTNTVNGVTRRNIQLPCEAICSVLADQAWSLTGKKIMPGVAHQCVTPGALAARLLEDDANVWSWPGRVIV